MSEASGANPAQINIAVPAVANAAREPRGGALHFGEDAKRHHFEQRHARARIHLGRNEDDVPQHHSDEQHGRALTDIGYGHGLQR